MAEQLKDDKKATEDRSVTKRSNENTPTSPPQGKQELLTARERLLAKAKRIPHPGTMRVTLFPNPRVTKRVTVGEKEPKDS